MSSIPAQNTRPGTDFKQMKDVVVFSLVFYTVLILKLRVWDQSSPDEEISKNWINFDSLA